MDSNPTFQYLKPASKHCHEANEINCSLVSVRVRGARLGHTGARTPGCRAVRADVDSVIIDPGRGTGLRRGTRSRRGVGFRRGAGFRSDDLGILRSGNVMFRARTESLDRASSWFLTDDECVLFIASSCRNSSHVRYGARSSTSLAREKYLAGPFLFYYAPRFFLSQSDYCACGNAQPVCIRG